MLTADLVRAQVRKEQVIPRWIDPEKEPIQALAERILEIFAHAHGRAVSTIREHLAELEAEHSDPLLVKGMAKLVWDRCTIDTDAPVPPGEARKAVFEAARQAWPVRPGGGKGFADRDAIIAAVAERFGVSPEGLERSLFADRAEAQRVTALELPEATALTAAYNLALAQACLLRAREARILFEGLDNKRLRALMRAVKFHRLLAHATRRGDDSLELRLDGPLSLHHQTGRYGVQLARMLPAIARAERWSLEADVVWHRGAKKGVPATFKLDEKSPIGRAERGGPLDRGVWESDEERHLRDAMARVETPWRLEEGLELFDLGGRDLLAPDLRLVHPDGRVAWVELVWTWRQKTMTRKLELLREFGPPALVVAWAKRGGVEGALDVLDLPGAYGFKGVISPKELIARAEAVARVPEDAVPPAKAPGKKKTRRAKAGPD